MLKKSKARIKTFSLIQLCCFTRWLQVESAEISRHRTLIRSVHIINEIKNLPVWFNIFCIAQVQLVDKFSIEAWTYIFPFIYVQSFGWPWPFIWMNTWSNQWWEDEDLTTSTSTWRLTTCRFVLVFIKFAHSIMKLFLFLFFVSCFFTENIHAKLCTDHIHTWSTLSKRCRNFLINVYVYVV